jgi:hypothetical protein
MHVCLSVDEILRLVVCELVGSEANATAVALACSCKSFADPALDVVWETQGRLLMLLKSLPGDVWNGDGCTVSTPIAHVLFFLNHLDQKTFRRLPTTLEWARFRKYARRMRMITEPGAPDSLSPEVFAVLQSHVINEPLFPNLKSLDLWATVGEFIPFIPSFLSPTTAVITITFGGLDDPPSAAVASMITTFVALCPNLQEICLYPLPRDPRITAAVSEFLLTANRDALRCFRVDSPLTEEARQVVYNLPNLCRLWVVVEGTTSIPTMVLPNIIRLDVDYNRTHDWLQGFRGAKLGRLNSVTFCAESKPGGFLEEFQSVMLTTSTPNTLSAFHFHTSHSWNPNYSSLLAFEQLTELEIDFSCRNGCSSRVDDDVVVSLARAMPKLEILRLGKSPCGTPAGVTFKGLIALACRCPRLYELRIHFRANSLVEATTSGEPPFPSKRATAIPPTDCMLAYLHVGEIPISEGSALAVALILLQIFPHIFNIYSVNLEWWSVAEAIKLFNRIGGHVRHASKTHLPHLLNDP